MSVALKGDGVRKAHAFTFAEELGKQVPFEQWYATAMKAACACCNTVARPCQEMVFVNDGGEEGPRLFFACHASGHGESVQPTPAMVREAFGLGHGRKRKATA